MSGGYDYDKAYSKYKPDVDDAQFEAYVDATPDLKDAWAEIQSEPTGEQGSYWTPRGATSKAAFGRAHAAEDQALSAGTYVGGTDVMPGTTDYTDYFGAGDTPDTRFEEYVTGGGDTTVPQDTGWATARGGGAPGSANYPMGLVDYQEPSAMSGIPLDFQPWMQPDHIPDSLWNYQAPTLNEWEVERDWDWATKPASEYGPQPETALTTENGYGPEGGSGDAPPGGWGSGDGFGVVDDITKGYNAAKLAGMTSGWLDNPTQFEGDWSNPNVNVDDSGWTVG